MGRRPKVTREEVLTAARAAFAERGFDATTLSAIAASGYPDEWPEGTAEEATTYFESRVDA